MPFKFVKAVRVACLLTGLAAGATPASAADVFTDDFAAGPVTDAGPAVGFWTVRAAQGAFATKADGTLTLESSGPAEWANVHLVSAVRPDFDFFAGPLTFSLDDVALAVKGVPPEKATLRFSVAPAAVQEWVGETGVSLSVTAARRIRLGYKVATPKKDPDAANILVEQTVPGDVTGIDLTLDAAGYALTVRHKDDQGNPAAAPFVATGKWADKGPGLTRESWGGGGSAVMIQCQRAKLDVPADTSATLTVSSFKVTSGPASAAGVLTEN